MNKIENIAGKIENLSKKIDNILNIGGINIFAKPVVKKIKIKKNEVLKNS
jgi:hypothetical protein